MIWGPQSVLGSPTDRLSIPVRVTVAKWTASVNGRDVMKSEGGSWRLGGVGSRKKNFGDFENRRGRKKSGARSGQSVGAAVGRSWRMKSL